MIPRRIKLRNFLSYRECEVDLRGIHIAVLTGKNGEGKSALLDAMTWAVWGAARGSLEEDRIRLHADEMLVDFEFEAHGDRFEVIRKRTRGKRSGEVHFFQLGPDGSRTTLTGGTSSETQAEIIRRVRTDYDTFASSAFVAQGHADEFTKKKPAERKEIFRKVLGLQLYEELSAAAGDRKKQATIEAKAIGQRLGEAEAEVRQLPAVDENLARLAGDVCALQPQKESLERQTAELQRLQSDFRRVAAEAEAARERETRARAAVSSAGGLFEEAERDLATATCLLAKADDVRGRHAAFTALRDRERELATVQERASAVAERLRDAGQEVAREEMRLRTLAEGAQAEVDRLTAVAAGLSALQRASAALETEERELAALDATANDCRAETDRLKTAQVRAEAEARHCKEENKGLFTRQEQLKSAAGEASCPVCGQPMDRASVQQVLEEYSAQRRLLGERFKAADGQAREAMAAVATLEAQLALSQDEHRRRGDDLRRRQRDHHSQLVQATEAATLLPERQSGLTAALAVLTSADFAHEARRTHCAAREELSALGYDIDAHRRLRQELETLEGVEAELLRIVAAEERVSSLERQRAQLQCALAERTRELDEAAEAAASASAAVEAAEDVEPRLRASEEALAAVREDETNLAVQRGRLQERRAALHVLVAKVESAREEVQAHREAETTYGDLAKAFGRDGVQAMLIEQSLPRVEQVANEMLDRMTGGRINVALATQKQTASGTTRETLDIRISDELGTRDYEMYSGGEAFRVDFALRIALARLLAERSGAALPTLIIDEGFGSQDQEGIDRLVEAIQAISDDFKMILVVTHVEELRERFERRIEVTKDPERGSIARVV